MSGFTALVMGFPFPIGALTKSRKSASGWQAYRLAALQVSITEPPPTATNTSKESFLANAIASLKLRGHKHAVKNTHCILFKIDASQLDGRIPASHLLSVGSTRTLSNTLYLTPFWARDSRTALTGGRTDRFLSVIRQTFRAPRFCRSCRRTVGQHTDRHTIAHTKLSFQMLRRFVFPGGSAAFSNIG